jgi:hypothetical protein
VVLILVLTLVLPSRDQNKQAHSDDEVDPSIFIAIKEVLIYNYGKSEALANCMVDDFRRNKIVEKFYSPELLSDLPQLAREIEPFIADAEQNCKNRPSPELTGKSSKFGLFVALILVGVIILGGLIGLAFGVV